MLIVNCVPVVFWKLFQKCAINLGSLSDMIETGTPCNRTISQIYNRHNSSSVKVIRTARKCVDLVSQSTITHTASCLRCVHGKWVIKSIMKFSHFHSATSNGWSIPADFLYSYLLTRETPSNKISSVSLHLASIILATKISVHLHATWMHSQNESSGTP